MDEPIVAKLISDNLYVKVHRYSKDSMGETWDGWFFSKVYAISGYMFLVYDNGEYSSCSGEDGFPDEFGFTWVDASEIMKDCMSLGKKERFMPLVQLYDKEEDE